MTLLGATPSVEQLVAAASAEGMTHLALTDTNALYAAVMFARACRGEGIHPVIGLTVTVQSPIPPGGTLLPAHAAPGHLVLLARDATGYRSLCRLSTSIQGRPDREAVAAQGLPWDDIASNRAGLICLSGGRRGWIERFIRSGDMAAAMAYAGRLAGTFDDDAYLSLEVHAAADWSVTDEIAGLGRRLGIPLVAVQPVYTMTSDEAWKLPLLAAIRDNRRLAGYEHAEDAEETDEDDTGAGVLASPATVSPRDGVAKDTGRKPRESDSSSQHPSQSMQAIDRDELARGRVATPLPDDEAPLTDVHWLSADEVRRRFARRPSAVEAAGEIAARCGEALPDGRPIWPALDLPPAQTPADTLRELAYAGLARRYPTGAPGPRLEHELAAIARQGYSPLFLVVADIVRFARKHGVPVSTRGSVANSLVAYCMGITTVDPVEHGLLFERFLNPSRANPPDIDLDFCSERRNEVLRYVRERYGAEHVALVCTISTLRLQSAAREVGRAHGLSEEAVSQLAGAMPGRWHPDPRRRDTRTIDDILLTLPDPQQRSVARQAWELVGTPDHISIHPGGVVITPGPLTDVTPLQWTPKGFLVTQYEHGDVEQIGLPKLDLLGIRALTVLADAVELIRARHDPDFDLENIAPNDPATGDMIERGATIGVFQCESDGAQRTLRKLRARTIRDMAIANAFFKPGPAMGGMADRFVARYRGEEAVDYLHPSLASILGPTMGVLIFQEQVLRLATEVAGLSWSQADHLRRGMSHFGRDEMAALRDAFVEGCLRPVPDGPGMSRGTANKLWEQVIPFSGYGFNQGHATAYAAVSYRSAYLKAHYPAEFFCARLRGWGGYHHAAVYMAEAVRLGISIHPPHVNRSHEEFSLADKDPRAPSSAPHRPVLYQGLGQVRDLRARAVAAILAERDRGGSYRDLRDLLSRVELQPKETDHLIRCGALDGLGDSRAAVLAEAETMRRRGGAAQLAFAFARPEVEAEGLAQRWAWEQELLANPVSSLGDPLATVRDSLGEHVSLRELAATPGRLAVTAGVRLPGWTGGPGFFLFDGERFAICRAGKGTRATAPWKPLRVRGRWLIDQFGGAWLEAAQVEAL
jgi:DNA-directed DNA polymerase III PolC